MPKIEAQTLRGLAVSIDVDRHPDTCPQCHAFIQPKFWGAIAEDPFMPDSPVGVIFQCPRQSCQQPFIAYYTYISRPQSTMTLHELRAVAPRSARPSGVPPEVASVSGSFAQIYAQALTAEARDLRQLVGCGLRKALEFLIKDYAISRTPDAADEIKGMWLAACIDRFVSDGNIKECARRAAWLGNDDTHYVRLWTDKDVGDLKALIRLTMIWIESALVTEKYMKEMPDRKEAPHN